MRIAAVVSTMAYDFFFTHPYQSLKIDKAEDIGTAVLLLAIGLLVAQLTSFAHQSHRRSERTHDELLRVHQVAELAAQGMAIDDLIARGRDRADRPARAPRVPLRTGARVG